jgi:hypothetical protein
LENKSGFLFEGWQWAGICCHYFNVGGLESLCRNATREPSFDGWAVKESPGSRNECPECRRKIPSVV